MPPEIAELLVRISELNETELAELASALEAHANTLLDQDATDETLAELAEVADGLRQVAEVQAAAAAEAADRVARRDALRDQIQSMTGPEADAEAEAAPAAEAEAEAAPAAELEPVTAAAAPRITRAAARRPAAMTPRPIAEVRPVSLTAAGTFDTIQVGQQLNTISDQARAFQHAFTTSRGYRGPRVQIPVMRAQADFGPERQLGRDPQLNAARIDAVTSRQAIMASGGICAPTEVRYDLPVLGDDARPVRDGLARFGVDRGGIRTITPPIFSEMDGAVSVWTEANDQNPVSPTTKPCLTVTCPDDSETVVDAIVKCLEFGNFRQRFFPEQVAAWVQLAGVQHAREAETRMLTAIGAGSTTVSAGQLLGATRDILATQDRAIAGMKSRHRAQNISLRWVAPTWVHDMIRTDLARQMPVGTVDETLAVADAMIDRFFAARGVKVTWTLDGETGQVFGAQGDGALLGWPSTIISYLFVEGSWLFLDGGQLDLGIVRDSTLNGTNDFQMFAETLEAVHFHGTESLRITMDVCPDGAASALTDIDPCSTGS